MALRSDLDRPLRGLARGQRLPEHVARVRHSAILALLSLHVLVLTAGGLLGPHPAGEVLAGGGALGLAACLAAWERLPARLRALIAALGLIGASALFVHLWGGGPAQFHIFVVVAVLALYQDRLLLLPAIAYVLVQTGLVGAVFASAAIALHVLGWRMNEAHLMRDPLTGLPSMPVLRSRLAVALHRLQRRHGQHVAVLVLDLDRFKTVNDRLGHPAGDELILSVADRLRHTVRGHDTIARLGGDEFAILCDDVPDDASASVIADRVLRSFGRPFALSSGAVSATASIGLALTADPAHDGQALLERADAAMCRAKQAGGRSYALHGGGAPVEDMGEPGVDDVALEPHPELLHDAPRGAVVGQRVGDDVGQLEHVERDA
jgi:diguanylate cyclase (GGDEF)-like protein